MLDSLPESDNFNMQTTGSIILYFNTLWNKIFRKVENLVEKHQQQQITTWMVI